MNTLYIHDSEIDLIGFDDLKTQAFFIFRENGLIISPRQENVHAEQISCNIFKKKIKNDFLVNKLIQLGFLNVHYFTKGSDETYYCLYPKEH